MTITRIQSVSIDGKANLAWQSPDLKLRRANVGLEQLLPTLERNGRDEVVFEGADERLYVLDAVKLSTGDAPGPRIGDEIAVGGYSGRVVAVDIDPARARGWAAMGTMAATIASVPFATKLAATGGAVDPLSAALIASAVFLTGFTGASLVNHRGPDDAALSGVTTLLAADKKGRLQALEADLAAREGRLG